MGDLSVANRSFASRVVWAAVWSALLTFLAYRMIDSSNQCYSIVNGSSWIRLVFGSTWVWLFLFLLFDSNRGRFLLLAVSVVAVLAIGNVDRVPLAAAEASAVDH